MPDASDAPSKSAAFFDVDGTLVSTHIVHQYVYVRRKLAEQRDGSWTARLFGLWLAAFYVKCLHYLYLDRVSRTRMNIAFYRNYGGLSCDRVRGLADDCFQDVLKPHLFSRAVKCVRHHQGAGRRVVLVTGSVDLFIDPLARHLGALQGEPAAVDLLARSLETRNGRFTGALNGPPIGEQEKADVLKTYAESHGIDLSACYAYGDSIADRPMLELVGHPQVVNADSKLAIHAAARGWPALVWDQTGSGA